MAQRRMFSLKVVDTDFFLEMPQSTQNLYFHLGMRADDDGFVPNPKKIMGFVSSKEDDIKILISKKFIIPFQSGVIVIRHWHENNYIQKDRKHETLYNAELAMLTMDENGTYDMDTKCIQDVSKLDTEERLGKVRLGKVRKGEIGKHQVAESVFLSTDQFFSLREKFGKVETRERIQRLNDYKCSTGKKYASDYHTILNWARKDKENGRLPKSGSDSKPSFDKNSFNKYFEKRGGRDA